MSKYSILERRKIYQKAIALLEKETFGCHAIAAAAGISYSEAGGGEDLFPEFFLFREQDIHAWLCLHRVESNKWHHKENMNMRRVVLELCVEMCNKN